MSTIKIDILNERAMALIRYLENVGDVRITQDEEPLTRVEDTAVDYALNERKIVNRDWYGILSDHPNKGNTLNYFDRIRDEWDDRY